MQRTVTLDEAALLAACRLRGTVDATALQSAADSPPWPEGGSSRPRNIVGLYTGGTLAHEAETVLRGALGPAGLAKDTARILDLGDDRFTVGRPHPMIDPALRNEILAFDRDGMLFPPETDCIVLFDLILGRGAHPDPASGLARALEQARKTVHSRGGRLLALGSIVGTARDPQSLERQSACLRAAGARLFSTNSAAARQAARYSKGEA